MQNPPGPLALVQGLELKAVELGSAGPRFRTAQVRHFPHRAQMRIITDVDFRSRGLLGKVREAATQWRAIVLLFAIRMDLLPRHVQRVSRGLLRISCCWWR